MLVHKELPDNIAEIFNLPIEEMKKRVITINGLTVAQEEEILKARKEESGQSMTPEEYLKHVDTIIDKNEN